MTPVTKPLWQRFLVFLVPLMLSNILQSMSGTINNIFIGQMIGVDALASVSVFFPIMFLMISFVVGLASGAAILIGQAYGAKNSEKIREVTGTTLTVTFLAAIVIAAGGWLLAPQLITLLGAAENIAPTAAAYARVVFLGMPFFFVFMVLTSMLRGVGDTTTPLITLGFSILAGLVGVLFILKPTDGGFDRTLILPILNAVQMAIYSVCTRIVGRDEQASTSFFYLGVVGCFAASCVGPFYLSPVAGIDWMWFAIVSMTSIASHYFLIMAYKRLDAIQIQPISYFQLVWASVLGVAIFGEALHWNVLAGSLIVVCAGLFTIWREAVRRRAAPADANMRQKPPTAK